MGSSSFASGGHNVSLVLADRWLGWRQMDICTYSLCGHDLAAHRLKKAHYCMEMSCLGDLRQAQEAEATRDCEARRPQDRARV